MLQLTFHALPPCPLFTAMAHDSYHTLKYRGDARLKDGCLSITLSDLGESARTRYRLVFECAGSAGCAIRVVTEAADMHAALRSGFAVMLGSCTASVCRQRVARTDARAPTESALADAVCV
jgi:hypothetical protein